MLNTDYGRIESLPLPSLCFHRGLWLNTDYGRIERSFLSALILHFALIALNTDYGRIERRAVRGVPLLSGRLVKHGLR